MHLYKFIGNLDTNFYQHRIKKVYGAWNRYQDAEILANIIGTCEEHEITAQINNKIESAGSIKKVREFLVHPDRIKDIQLGDSFLVKKSPYVYVIKAKGLHLLLPLVVGEIR